MTHYSHNINELQNEEDDVPAKIIQKPDSGLGLYGYLENYRKLIGEMAQLDSIVKKQGKTLNLSTSVRSHRVYKTRDPRQQGAIGPPSQKYPRHIIDYAKFVQCLRNVQASEEEVNRPCYFTVEEQPEREGWFNNMFFCSYSMRESYLTYRDFIFVNKRLSKTRYSRCLLMFCGISSSGRSVLLGFAMLAKEDEDGYFFAVS